jgi:hypothetical protein
MDHLSPLRREEVDRQIRSELIVFSAAQQLLKNIPGAKLGVRAFMLEAALEKARKITGEK